MFQALLRVRAVETKAAAAARRTFTGPGWAAAAAAQHLLSQMWRADSARSVCRAVCAPRKLPCHVPYYALAPMTDRGLFPQWSPPSP